MVYKLVLGDWSKDGHKQSEDFLFDCNYDVHKIRQAYKDSCKKLGVAFHDEDYENCTKPLSDDYSNVWTDYETPYTVSYTHLIFIELACVNKSCQVQLIRNMRRNYRK